MYGHDPSILRLADAINVDLREYYSQIINESYGHGKIQGVAEKTSGEGGGRQKNAEVVGGKSNQTSGEVDTDLCRQMRRRAEALLILQGVSIGMQF